METNISRYLALTVCQALFLFFMFIQLCISPNSSMKSILLDSHFIDDETETQKG